MKDRLKGLCHKHLITAKLHQPRRVKLEGNLAFLLLLAFLHPKQFFLHPQPVARSQGLVNVGQVLEEIGLALRPCGGELDPDDAHGLPAEVLGHAFGGDFAVALTLQSGVHHQPMC